MRLNSVLGSIVNSSLCSLYFVCLLKESKQGQPQSERNESPTWWSVRPSVHTCPREHTHLMVPSSLQSRLMLGCARRLDKVNLFCLLMMPYMHDGMYELSTDAYSRRYPISKSDSGNLSSFWEDAPNYCVRKNPRLKWAPCHFHTCPIQITKKRISPS